MRLNGVSVGRLMRTMGISPQCTFHRAYRQGSVLVGQWLTKDYPKIRKQAESEKAVIFVDDKSGIRSDYRRGLTWASVSKMLVVVAIDARLALNMSSVVSAQGQFSFMVHEGTAPAETFCTFLTRLARGIEQRLFLIVDGHRSHRAGTVQALLNEIKGKIALFALPQYSPQPNPDGPV